MSVMWECVRQCPLCDTPIMGHVVSGRPFQEGWRSTFRQPKQRVVCERCDRWNRGLFVQMYRDRLSDDAPRLPG